MMMTECGNNSEKRNESESGKQSESLFEKKTATAVFLQTHPPYPNERIQALCTLVTRVICLVGWVNLRRFCWSTFWSEEQTINCPMDEMGGNIMRMQALWLLSPLCFSQVCSVLCCRLAEIIQSAACTVSLSYS